MSRWHDNFNKHPLHSNIGKIREVLSDDAFKDLDSDSEQEFSRFRKVFALLVNLLETADQELISNGQLNQLNTQTMKLITDLEQYKTHNNIAQLQSANNNIDQTLQTLVVLGVIASPQNVTYETSINSLIERGEAFLSDLNERKSKLQKEVEQLIKNETVLGEKIDGLEEQLNAKISELNSLSNDWTSKFNESQTDKQTEFQSLFKKIDESASKEIKELIEHYQTQISQDHLHLKEEIDKHLVEIKERHKNIKELHQLISNDSVTGGYQKSAAEETNAANGWRYFSVILGACAIIWQFYMYHKAGEISYIVSFNGLPVTLLLLALAGFSMRQSSLHRKYANSHRKKELELLAIDPYLESLGEEKHIEIKSGLTSKFFGQAEEPGHPD